MYFRLVGCQENRDKPEMCIPIQYNSCYRKFYLYFHLDLGLVSPAVVDYVVVVVVVVDDDDDALTLH